MAQCEPRLIGESQLGSWPTQTPFTTSAVTVQPTAQCVQMLLRMVAPDVSGMAAAASALRTPVSGNAPRAARPPAVRPDRRRNVRRSRPLECVASVAASVPRRAWRSVRLISTGASSGLGRITVHAIVGLHVIGFPVTGFSFFIVGLAVRLGGGGERSSPRRRRRRRQAREGSHDGRPWSCRPWFCPASSRVLRAALSLAVSRRQRKCLRFYFHEHPAQRAYSAVEFAASARSRSAKKRPIQGDRCFSKIC